MSNAGRRVGLRCLAKKAILLISPRAMLVRLTSRAEANGSRIIGSLSAWTHIGVQKLLVVVVMVVVPAKLLGRPRSRSSPTWWPMMDCSRFSRC